MKVFWDYDLQLPGSSLPNAAVYFDNRIIGAQLEENKTNVAVVTCEPFEIISHDVEKYLLRNWADFDLILTDKLSLLTLPNAVIFVYAHPQVSGRDARRGPLADGVSTIIGHKMWTIGHRMRHVLWDRRHEITRIPTYFFASHLGGPPSSRVLYQDKAPLFDYQFHIAIENTQSPFYITEKALDCFRTGVLPIYYGATQVDEFFDERGFIAVDSVDDIIYSCNQISTKFYESKRKFIGINMQLSESYVSFGSRVVEAINRHLGAFCVQSETIKTRRFGHYAGTELKRLRSGGYRQHPSTGPRKPRAANFGGWLRR